MTIFIPRLAPWVHSARFTAESLGYVIYRWSPRVLVMKLPVPVVTNVVGIKRNNFVEV